MLHCPMLGANVVTNKLDHVKLTPYSNDVISTSNLNVIYPGINCVILPVTGLNVREKAKQLVNLLKDDERLKNERARALKAKQRFAQSATAFGSDVNLDTPTSPTYPTVMAPVSYIHLLTINYIYFVVPNPTN